VKIVLKDGCGTVFRGRGGLMCGVPGIVGDVESGRFMPRMVGWNWAGAGVTKGAFSIASAIV
jgi:hypothetical protein